MVYSLSLLMINWLLLLILLISFDWSLSRFQWNAIWRRKIFFNWSSRLNLSSRFFDLGWWINIRHLNWRDLIHLNCCSSSQKRWISAISSLNLGRNWSLMKLIGTLSEFVLLQALNKHIVNSYDLSDKNFCLCSNSLWIFMS